jgi:hypothetical protein
MSTPDPHVATLAGVNEAMGFVKQPTSINFEKALAP